MELEGAEGQQRLLLRAFMNPSRRYHGQTRMTGNVDGEDLINLGTVRHNMSCVFRDDEVDNATERQDGILELHELGTRVVNVDSQSMEG